MMGESTQELLSGAIAKLRGARSIVERELAARRRQPPRPGEIFLVEATRKTPFEWAVLAAEADGSLVVAPVDTSPMAGSSDVRVPEEAPCGAVTIRCGEAVDVDHATLTNARRTGLLPADALAEACTLRAATTNGTVRERLFGDDDDPEYRDWMEHAADAGRRLVATGSQPRVESLGERPADRFSRIVWRPRVYATAATVLTLLSLGLAVSWLAAARRLSEQETLAAARLDELRRSYEEELQAVQSAAQRAREDLREAQRLAERLRAETARADEERLLLADRLDKLEQGRLRDPILNLDWHTVTRERRVRGAPNTVEVSSDVEYFALVFSIKSKTRYPEYRLQIVDLEGGRTVWVGESLEAGRGFHEVRIALPRAGYGPGKYLFLIDGLSEAGRERLEEYEVEIRVE